VGESAARLEVVCCVCGELGCHWILHGCGYGGELYRSSIRRGIWVGLVGWLVAMDERDENGENDGKVMRLHELCSAGFRTEFIAGVACRVVKCSGSATAIIAR
jgi:hypothetical protein